MNEQVVSMVTEEKGAVIAPKKVKHMSIGKKIAVCLGVAALSSCMALSVSATGEESGSETATINSVMTSSFSTLKDDIINTATTVLPYGLGIFGVTFCVRKGKKIFRSVSN